LSHGRVARDRWLLGTIALIALVALTFGGGGRHAEARRRHHRASPSQASPPRASPPPPPAEIDPALGCQSNPALVGPCFELQGRSFRAANGTPSLRIQPARSRKALGVLPSEAEIIPACLEDLLQPGVEVHGRFLVCPLTVPARGQMQMICVQEARQLVALRWDPATQQRIPMGGAPLCALEAPVK
jgi:hypothetical protein